MHGIDFASTSSTINVRKGQQATLPHPCQLWICLRCSLVVFIFSLHSVSLALNRTQARTTMQTSCNFSMVWLPASVAYMSGKSAQLLVCLQCFLSEPLWIWCPAIGFKCTRIWGVLIRIMMIKTIVETSLGSLQLWYLVFTFLLIFSKPAKKNTPYIYMYIYYRSI